MIILLNALNIVAILLGFVFQLLLMRTFGVSLDTDVFFLSNGIVQFASGIISGFFADLYIPVYHEIRASDEHEAERFSRAVIALSLLAGIASLMVFFIGAPWLVRLFASGFSQQKIEVGVSIFKIQVLSLPFLVSSVVLSNTLNAHLHMRITYLANLVTPAISLIAVATLANSFGLSGIVWAIVIASSLVFLILFAYHWRVLGWSWVSVFKNPNIGRLLRQNLPVRAGIMVYLFKGPINTNVLSFFPTGTITLFTYADKILFTAFNVATSPVIQVLYVKASSLLTQSNRDELKAVLRSTITSNVAITTAIMIPAVIFFREILSFLLSPKVSELEIGTMFLIFLALIPFYISLSFESPFVVSMYALRRGVKVLAIAIAFIIVYGLLVTYLRALIGVFALPAALFLAQIQNSISFAYFVQKRIPAIDGNLKRYLLKIVLFMIAFILLNFYFREQGLVLYAVDLALVIGWLGLMGTETWQALKLFTKKGEVR